MTCWNHAAGVWLHLMLTSQKQQSPGTAPHLTGEGVEVLRGEGLGRWDRAVRWWGQGQEP